MILRRQGEAAGAADARVLVITKRRLADVSAASLMLNVDLQTNG